LRASKAIDAIMDARWAAQAIAILSRVGSFFRPREHWVNASSYVRFRTEVHHSRCTAKPDAGLFVADIGQPRVFGGVFCINDGFSGGDIKTSTERVVFVAFMNGFTCLRVPATERPDCRPVLTKSPVGILTAML
jgi:hypothetical protein